MTSRDTYDIEEYAREQEREMKRINVQPALLIKLLMESEPCLFSNKSEPIPVKEVSSSIKVPQFENVIWREE